MKAFEKIIPSPPVPPEALRPSTCPGIPARQMGDRGLSQRRTRRHSVWGGLLERAGGPSSYRRRLSGKGMIIAGTCLFIAVQAGAAEDEAGNVFRSSLNMGLTLEHGNSETLLVHASFLTRGEQESLGSILAGLEANYGESAVDDYKDTTVENARLFANAKKTITPKTFAFLDGSLLYDDIAEIDRRTIISSGFGAYLVKSESASLFVEAGPGYVWEKVSDVSDDYLALRFAERLEYALTPAARVWQSFEYLPRADDFGDHLMNAELGAEAAMNARLNLRVWLKNSYDSTPGEGLKNNDLSLIAGISVLL